MKPKDITEIPLGAIRRTNGQTETILLVENTNGRIDDIYSDIITEKSATGNYFVFSFPQGFEQFNNNVYTLSNILPLEVIGYEDLQEAQDKYIELADSQTGKTRKKWEADKDKMLKITGEYS